MSFTTVSSSRILKYGNQFESIFDFLGQPFCTNFEMLTFTVDGAKGMTRTKQRLRQYYWWSSMDKQVEELIHNCVVCSSSDKTTKTYTAPMIPISFPDEPWKKISMDIVWPMDTLPYDCRYAVTLKDLPSKWPEIAFYSKVTSETVIAFLQKVFCREGQVEEIVTPPGTDNGGQFTLPFLKNSYKPIM